MTKTFFAIAASIVALTSGAVSAATVSTSLQMSQPSAAAVLAGAPDKGQIHKFFLTSDADVLSIDQVSITGATLFQVAPPFGSNVEPPAQAFIDINRSLEADSWVSTPGATTLLGADLPGDGNSTFGDTSNNGAQTSFQFAQLTIPAGAKGLFTGRIQLAGATGPEAFGFSFQLGVPEPASIAMAGMGLIGMIGVARRRNA